MVDEQEGCEWMDVSSGHPARPGQRAVKRSFELYKVWCILGQQSMQSPTHTKS